MPEGRWTDPASGLEVRCVAVDYADFPAAEWTVYFKNNGKQNTPILEKIQGLDVTFERGQETQKEFVLHYSVVSRMYVEWMRERWNHPCFVIWDAQNESTTDETGKATHAVRRLDLSGRPSTSGGRASPTLGNAGPHRAAH